MAHPVYRSAALKNPSATSAPLDLRRVNSSIVILFSGVPLSLRRSKSFFTHNSLVWRDRAILSPVLSSLFSRSLGCCTRRLALASSACRRESKWKPWRGGPLPVGIGEDYAAASTFLAPLSGFLGLLNISYLSNNFVHFMFVRHLRAHNWTKYLATYLNDR